MDLAGEVMLSPVLSISPMLMNDRSSLRYIASKYIVAAHGFKHANHSIRSIKAELGRIGPWIHA